MKAEIKRLEQRQLELEHRLHAIRSDYHRGLDQDSEEQAAQLENMDVLQEIGRLAERELLQIRERLAELKRG